MKQKIKIPKSISDIKIWQYTDLLMSEGKTDKDIVSTICCIRKNEVDKLSFKTISDIKNKIESLFLKIENAIKKGLDEFKLVSSFKIDGVEYAIEPDMELISYGQLLDMELFSKSDNDITKFLYCFYRPVTHKKRLFFFSKKSPVLYRIEKYFNDDPLFDKKNKEYHYNQLRLLSVDVYLGLCFFFINLQEKSTIGLNTYIQSHTKGKDLRDLTQQGRLKDSKALLLRSGEVYQDFFKLQKLLAVNRLRQCTLTF